MFRIVQRSLFLFWVKVGMESGVWCKKSEHVIRRPSYVQEWASLSGDESTRS